MLISYLVLKGIGGQGPQLENEQRKNAVEIITCKIMSEIVSSGSKGSEREGGPVKPAEQENTEVEAREGLVWEQEKRKEQVGPHIPSELVLESCCVVRERHRPSKASGIPNKMAENEANKWFQKLGSHRSATSADRC